MIASNFVLQIYGVTQGFVHKSSLPYNCTKIWPLPKVRPFIHGFAIANNRMATFESSTMTSKMGFLQDLKMKGPNAIVSSAWLEMIQEALSVLFVRSTKDIHICKDVVLGTIEDRKGSHDKIHCVIDTILGFASITDATSNNVSAKITKITGVVYNIKEHRAPLSRLLIRVPTYVGAPRKSNFAKAIVAKDALDFLVHPGIIQSSLTLHHLALAAHHQCALVSFVSCATVAIEDTCNNRCCTDVPSKVTICEHRCQDLRCTNMHGQAFLQFNGMQMRLENESLPGPSNLSTLSLEWQPLAMSTSTQNTFRYASPLKWVILSEVPCSIGDLCYSIDRPVIATTIVLSGRGCCHPSEMHIDNEEDLVHFLSTVKADNCLLVQSLRENDGREEKSSAESAMLWVFRAYARAPTTFKMSLVTRREGQYNTPPGLTLCQGRTFQEQPRLVMYGHLQHMRGLPFIYLHRDMPMYRYAMKNIISA